MANFGVRAGRITLCSDLWPYPDRDPKYIVGQLFPQGLPFGPFPLYFNAFWLYSDRAGDYLLEYKTFLGTFYILLRTTTGGSAAIFLHPTDSLLEATLHEGTIIGNNLPVVYKEAGAQVFGELPFMHSFPSGLFTPTHSTLLLQPSAVAVIPFFGTGGLGVNPDVGICPGPSPFFTTLECSCYPWP
jgi:hypothetical protein